MTVSDNVLKFYQFITELYTKFQNTVSSVNTFPVTLCNSTTVAHHYILVITLSSYWNLSFLYPCNFVQVYLSIQLMIHFLQGSSLWFDIMYNNICLGDMKGMRFLLFLSCFKQCWLMSTLNKSQNSMLKDTKKIKNEFFPSKISLLCFKSISGSAQDYSCLYTWETPWQVFHIYVFIYIHISGEHIVPII